MATMATQTSCSGELYFELFELIFKVPPEQVTKVEHSKNREKSSFYFIFIFTEKSECSLLDKSLSFPVRSRQVPRKLAQVVSVSRACVSIQPTALHELQDLKYRI